MYLPVLAELKRRRVFRAIVGYGIAAFAVLQIIEPVMHGLHWPDGVLSAVVVALAVGFPIVVAMAWIFDAGPGGIERTPPTAGVGRRHVALLIAAATVIAAVPVVWHFAGRRRAEATVALAPSIAVLPFADMSPGKDQEYFADGVAEQILSALAHVKGLRVIGRTSSFSFKGKSTDLRNIGKELGAGAILEGSVRRDGDRIRVTTQLINSADGINLWSEVYDRKLADVFAVQDEISRAVVSALRIKLVEPSRAGSEGTTANVEAYNQYLIGQQFYRRGSVEAVRHAATAFEKAVSLDPGFAPAWAGIVRAHAMLESMAGEDLHYDTLAAAADKAIALAPDLADGWVARGVLRGRRIDQQASSRADLERALGLNPSDTVAIRFLAQALMVSGHLADGIALAKKAALLDPLDVPAWYVYGRALCWSLQLDAARVALDHALEISPEAERPAYVRALVDLLDARPQDALARAEKLRSDSRLQMVALAQHTLGHDEDSREALVALSADEQASYGIAEVYAWRGERDRAFEWLEKAYAQSQIALTAMGIDPLMRSLHGDPRFAVLLRKLNLPGE